MEGAVAYFRHAPPLVGLVCLEKLNCFPAPLVNARRTPRQKTVLDGSSSIIYRWTRQSRSGAALILVPTLSHCHFAERVKLNFLNYFYGRRASGTKRRRVRLAEREETARLANIGKKFLILDISPLASFPPKRFARCCLAPVAGLFTAHPVTKPVTVVEVPKLMTHRLGWFGCNIVVKFYPRKIILKAGTVWFPPDVVL